MGVAVADLQPVLPFLPRVASPGVGGAQALEGTTGTGTQPVSLLASPDDLSEDGPSSSCPWIEALSSPSSALLESAPPHRKNPVPVLTVLGSLAHMGGIVTEVRCGRWVVGAQYTCPQCVSHGLDYGDVEGLFFFEAWL